MGRVCTQVFFAIALSGFAARGDAQDSLSLDAAIEQLHADKPEAVQHAIEALGLSGNKKATRPLADRIRLGLQKPLLDMAIDTLAALGGPEAGPVLFELAHHRRADVRLRAVDAIIATKPDGGAEALLSALSDQDPRIRGQAATGMGALGDENAVDTLFLALERGVLEAATSIGQLAQAAHVERLVGYLGRLPFDAITPALSELLARKDIDAKTKLGLIAKLGELATSEAKAFLEAFADALPPKGRHNQALRRAALDAVSRIAG